ncbi:Ig-like domain-containing protein [Paenibacillus massiliensis]|uniref:Ig-like domain-containing protein n=1 Tax=Paenibacillus massiliensis TaxID=225917 RepID=UPI00037540BC|nr:Ig-like domain-containing protein [Paenibacillus massiliensis]
MLKSKLCLVLLAFVVVATTLVPMGDGGTASAAEPARIPAFPGAEGGGMYTTGGRFGEVYEVTNLNDSGPGSFRDAVSGSDRIIVFKVGGNIHLKSRLQITGSNLTIAGQSAPGNGIAVLDYDTSLQGDNVIIRFMRFRLGDNFFSEEDAFGARKRKNVILDHCSFSHSVDEVLSPYQMENMTVQWSIISESMLMSNHSKGRHGYGGIWGGKNTTFHHNLIAHNASRNPRFGGEQDNIIDFRNNIIYNWQFMSTYGGERALGNIVGNYYKYGPDTDRTKRALLRDTPSKDSQWFIADNIVDGYPEIAEDNWLGVIGDVPEVAKRSEPVEMPYTYTAESATQAYERVLDEAGATYPARDSMDARVIQEVRERGGRLSNSQDEAGGFPALPEVTSSLVDSDGDGIPDDWELANALDPKDASDSQQIGPEGYTYLEMYLNELVADYTPSNPEVKLVAPEHGELVEAGEPVVLNATASMSQSAIQRVEFYANDVKLGEATAAPYELTWESPEDGTYWITARAYDTQGVAADSPVHPLYVVHPQEVSSPWMSVDIGSAKIPGHASEKDGVITLRSGGRIGGTDDPVLVDKTRDSFHYVYQTLADDGQIVARINEVGRVDNESQAGIMMRSSLDPDARMVTLTQSLVKYGHVARFWERTQQGGEAASRQIEDFLAPGYIKLVRLDGIVYGYLCQYGNDWTLVGTVDIADWPETIYVGLAADGALINNDIYNYGWGRFSEVAVSNLDSIPAIAQELEVQGRSEGIELGWQASEGATGYHIERSLVESGPYSVIAPSVTDTSYTDTTVEAGNVYYYRIIATNPAGDTLPSIAKSAAVPSNIAKQYTVKDNFDTTPANSPPAGYTVYPPYPGKEDAYVRVTELPDLANDEERGNGLLMQSSAIDLATLTKRFQAHADKLILEADVMVPIAASASDAGKHLIQLLNLPGGKSAVRLQLNKDGLSYITPAKETILLEQVDWKAGEWHRLRVELDVPAQQYSLYVDGEQVVEQQAFVDNPDVVGTFWVNSESRLYLDRIQAYRMVQP